MLRQNIYLIHSKSQKGKNHAVMKNGKEIWCSCSGYHYHKKCYHIERFNVS